MDTSITVHGNQVVPSDAPDGQQVHANKVSRGDRGDPPTTPWGRYLVELSKGRGREGAMRHSGITPKELENVRALPGMVALEQATMRAAVVGDTVALTRSLAAAGAHKYLAAVDNLLEEEGVPKDVVLRAARTGLEAVRILGAPSQQQGASVTVNAAQMVMIVQQALQQVPSEGGD